MVPASIVCCEVLALGVFERVFQFRASTGRCSLLFATGRKMISANTYHISTANFNKAW